MAQQEPRTYPWSETAPKLAQLTNDMLFDDVWERPGLSKRDRSLITVATLIASGPGRRKVTGVTRVPSRIPDVSRASPARVIHASVGPGRPSPQIVM